MCLLRYKTASRKKVLVLFQKFLLILSTCQIVKVDVFEWNKYIIFASSRNKHNCFIMGRNYTSYLLAKRTPCRDDVFASVVVFNAKETEIILTLFVTTTQGFDEKEVEVEILV